jgi:hypothetical protein
MQARNLKLHVSDQSSIPGNFWTAIDTLYVHDVVEHHCVDTPSEDIAGHIFQ